MRTALNNPFSPGSDTVPQVWAGRTRELSDWSQVVRPRRAAGLPERGRTFLGEPGVGKSALTRKIAHEATKAGDWATRQLRIPVGADPLKLLAEEALRLADLAGLPNSREKRIADLLSRIQTVAIQGTSVSLRQADGPEPFAALTSLLIEIGKAAINQDKVVLIHIDEVQNIKNADALSQLLISLGDTLVHEEYVQVPGGMRVSRTLPIAVYLTGLPDFEQMAGARRGATFARRFQTSVLTPISDDDLAAALRPFVLDGWTVPDDEGGTTSIYLNPDAADAIVELCAGDPFLFQLAGERAWYAGSGNRITVEDVYRGWETVAGEAARHVERMLARLPKKEREFLEAMAGLPPQERTLTNIAKAAGYDHATAAGPTAQRLDTTRGIISRTRPYTFHYRVVEAYMTSDWPYV